MKPATESPLSHEMTRVHPLPAPLDLIALHAAHPQRYPHLLQSAAHGRHDILFACPGESLQLQSNGSLTGPGATAGQRAFLDALDQCWHAERTGCAADPQAGPFTGGWFLYLGYELAAEIEPTLRLPSGQDDLPVAVATRFRAAVTRDRQTNRISLVYEEGAESQRDSILADIAALRPDTRDGRAGGGVTRISEEPSQRYLDAVARIQRYIHEGDVFQVNLSRRWSCELADDITAADLYRRLSTHNPAPFAGLATWPELAIISSSPERLVRVRGDRIETRPIAGTRPRSAAVATDRAYSEELLAHPKERAEHIMLIDLERNDLGRLCIPGSVEVNEFMVLESYAHVHHIVSNVRGRLRPDSTPGAVIRAVFPGGTITGCPKVRCMEIIAELEQVARGAYTGSMGYLNRDGNMDLNILIRSMVCAERRLSFRAGAGIVADSDAAAEVEETRAKARGLLQALGAG